MEADNRIALLEGSHEGRQVDHTFDRLSVVLGNSDGWVDNVGSDLRDACLASLLDELLLFPLGRPLKLLFDLFFDLKIVLRCLD